MRSTILVCDEDKEYVKAITAYLMSLNHTNRRLVVTGISEEENLTALSEHFDIVLASESMKESIESKEQVKRDVLFTLKESREDLQEKDFYKYQCMDTLVSILFPSIYMERLPDSKDGAFITGIYAPSKHELALPYALCLCRELSKEKETLFIDLSEIGVLPSIVGSSTNEDLIDLIFMLENQGFKGDIGNFITEYEGVYLLSSSSSPSQFSYITPAQWKNLFEKIKESGFKNIVVLFGNLVQGFSELAGELKNLVVIKKPGEYFSLAEGMFMDFMENLGLKNLCREVSVPLSISGTLQGPFRMGSLINGKLREYVRVEDVA